MRSRYHWLVCGTVAMSLNLHFSTRYGFAVEAAAGGERTPEGGVGAVPDRGVGDELAVAVHRQEVVATVAVEVTRAQLQARDRGVQVARVERGRGGEEVAALDRVHPVGAAA